MNPPLDERGPSLLENAPDEAFWRSFQPDLHISRFPLAGVTPSPMVDTPLVEHCTTRMVKEGYFEIPPVMSREQAARLAQVVADLVHRNIAPVFAFVYDEFWQMACRLHPVLRALLGDGYQLTPTDIWIWHVDKRANAAGWGPHRDLLIKESVRDDNMPRVVTLWMPLTDTTPLNACMYVLPTHLDSHLPDRIEDYSYNSGIMQSIRAVPAEAGSALGWNARILHWGGRSSEWAEQPRISAAIYFQSRDFVLSQVDYFPVREGFEPQTVDRGFDMPFQSRLRAIAGAIRLYAGRVRTDHPDICQELFAFSDAYIQPCQDGSTTAR